MTISESLNVDRLVRHALVDLRLRVVWQSHSLLLVLFLDLCKLALSLVLKVKLLPLYQRHVRLLRERRRKHGFKHL
jgi:hypothetical protein